MLKLTGSNPYSIMSRNLSYYILFLIIYVLVEMKQHTSNFCVALLAPTKFYQCKYGLGAARSLNSDTLHQSNNFI